MIRYLANLFTPSPAVKGPQHAANNPANQKIYAQNKAPQSQRNEFARAQATEQLMTYSAGGFVEGVGKFYQRLERERYLEHPVAKWLFTPLLSAVTYVSNLVSNENPDADSLEHTLQQYGSWGMGTGNLIKVGSNVWAFLKYKKMARKTDDVKILQKASNGNSWRNLFYLIEKGSFTLAGALYMVGNNYPSIGFMTLAQLAVIANAGISVKANWPVISRYFNDPKNMAMARDASKVTGLNLAKGIWGMATLMVASYLTIGPQNTGERLAFLEKMGITLNQTPESTADIFNLLVQSSWDLPPYLIAAGAVFMVAPFLISFWLNAKHAFIGPGREETEEGTKTDRLYHAIGAGVDICNAVGGYYTASLFWQPLGAVFNAMGSLGAYVQARYKMQINNAAPS